jgi:hypothetical protein
LLILKTAINQNKKKQIKKMIYVILFSIFAAAVVGFYLNKIKSISSNEPKIIEEVIEEEPCGCSECVCVIESTPVQEIVEEVKEEIIVTKVPVKTLKTKKPKITKVTPVKKEAKPTAKKKAVKSTVKKKK